MVCAKNIGLAWWCNVVFAPLFYAQMCIDASIAGCACEIFVFSVGYVLSRPVVPVFFGQTKVNEEQLQRNKNQNTGVKLICLKYICTISPATLNINKQEETLEEVSELANP